MKMSKIVVVVLFSTLGLFNSVFADTLIFSNNKKIHGSLTLIATKYIEFKTDELGPRTQWVQIYKKDILLILDDAGKIMYPRDKFDENALNYGKVKIRTEDEARKYNLRKQENIQAERISKDLERNKYKTAALVSLVGGVMALILIGA